MSADDYRYWAFISYSHRDRAWAEWLQRNIETWRVPRRLVGRPGPVGPVPRRLLPVFRDRDELPSSPNLNAAIDLALQQSRFLIVIASPYSAVSRWVEQEIQRFRAMGRGDRILCLIVDGEPNAAGHGQLECLPPSLRSGTGVEPIAADLRPGQDGRALARSKLLAGLLGVGLDELRRRERRRRQLRLAFGGLVLSLATGLALSGVQALRREAATALARQALQARVEKLYENGRQELQSHHEARAAVYLAAAYRLGRDTPALRFLLARAMAVVESEQLAFDTGAPLKGLGFSPDSRRLLTISTGNSAAVWDAASGRRLFPIELPAPAWSIGYFNATGDRIALYIQETGKNRLLVVDGVDGHHLNEIPLASIEHRPATLFDNSGRHLVYLDADGSAAIVDADTGTLRLRLPGPFTFVTYSRDGRVLVTGDAQGRVSLRDAGSGRVLRTFPALDSPIYALDTTADGRLLAAGGVAGGFRLWDTATGATRISAAHASRYIGHVFNTLDGSRLLTASTDSARVWDTRSGALLYSAKFSQNGERIHISEDGRRLINTGEDQLKVLDIDSGSELFSLDAHKGSVVDIDFSRDNRWLATAGGDGRIVIWALPQIPRAEFRHGRGPEGRADPVAPLQRTSAGFSADGRYLFSTGADGRVVLRDAGTLATLSSFLADADGVTDGAFSPDGLQLATGSGAGVALWSVPSGQLLRRFGAADKPLRMLRFAPDGKTLLGVYRGGRARLWNIAEGSQIAEWNQDAAAAATFLSGGQRLAVGQDGVVVMLDTGNGQMVWRHEFAKPQTGDGVAALDVSADGKRLLATHDHGDIDLLAADDGHLLLHDRDTFSERIITGQFDPAGNRILFGDWNRCATLLTPGQSRGSRLCGHGSQPSTAIFDPSGALALTASYDGTAKLWDVTDGSLLLPVAFHEGRIDFRGAVFDTDGSRLLTLSNDGSARLWDSGLERRSPAQVEAVLGCLVPWQLDGNALAPVIPMPERCRAPQP